MFPSRTSERVSAARGRDGFTLVEALAALAVAAVLLASIGSLMASNMRGSRRIAEHRELVETLRALQAELPERLDLVPGTLVGERGGYRWRIAISPLNGPLVNPKADRLLTPERVVITAWSPSGAAAEVETIRLRRKSDQ